MTKAKKTPANAANAVTFDNVLFSAGIAALLKMRKENKEAKEAMRLKEGKSELALILPAIEYAAQTFDLQPIARFIVETKPSALVKRIIKGCFPAHEFALVGDEKRAGFVTIEGQSKVADKAKIDVLRDAYASNDSIQCEQIKAAFPAPDLDKASKMEKLASAIAKRMKADGLTKADIAELIKGL